MTMKIDDLSIFGEYGQAENRLTVALLQILKIGGEPLIRYFAEEIGFTIPSSEIDIFSQVKGDGCVPDGLLESRFTFSLVIESKVKSGIPPKQLASLVKDRAKRGDHATLLYLTPHEEIPGELAGKPCRWANWIKVRDVLQSYLDKPEIEERDLLEFLVDQFDTFAGNLHVLEKNWAPPESRVLVVPAADARGIARQFEVYVCQNKRRFKPCKWIAFYAHGEIDTIADIAKPPEDDVLLPQHPELAGVTKVAPNLGVPRRVIRLRNVRSIGPIKNDLKDKNGKATAWVQNKRYTTIESIEKAKFTSELECGK